MARSISNKAKKTLSENGVSAYKVARAQKRERDGFSDSGRAKNRGYATKKETA